MSQKHCAYCKSILFDEDDVVVCPECGAYHHRECYAALGHCANQEKHGLELPDEVESEPTAEQTDNCAEDTPLVSIPVSRACVHCGMISKGQPDECPYCGADFSQEGSFRTFTGRIEADPLGGTDPRDTIDGIPVSDVAMFVRANTVRYVPLFKRMHERRRHINWNWAGFLLPQPWLFLRKCYMAGFVSTAAAVVSMLMSAPALQFMNNYISAQPLPTTRAQLLELQTAAAAAMPEWMQWLVIGSVAISIAIKVLVGIFGDKLYKNKVLDRLHSIADDRQIEDKSEAIVRAGGVNTVLAFIALLPTIINFLA